VRAVREEGSGLGVPSGGKGGGERGPWPRSVIGRRLTSA
jgi:hypothetical protein